MPRSNTPRVIILIDMDCFYASVEQRERPELRGKPVVVVQGHEYKGGGIIAVSYEARKFGVTRQMRANEALAKCPELAVCYVPVKHGKADLTRYRSVGAEIIKIISRFGDRVERASVDEAFIDVTDTVQKRLSTGDLDLHDLEKMAKVLPKTFVCGFPVHVHADCRPAPASTGMASCSNLTDIPRTVQPQASSAIGPDTDAGTGLVDETVAYGGGEDSLFDLDGDEHALAEEGGEVEDDMDAGAVPGGNEQSLEAWHGQCDDEQSLALLVGAVIASEMRQAVSTEARVSCSAGIAQNKMLAKLACGLHKPSQQTILPLSSAAEVFADLPFKKVRNLGGGFGKIVQRELNVKYVGALTAYSATDLQRRFGEKMGSWLYDASRGLCYEPVRERCLAQSLGSSKNFPGPKKLVSHEQIRFWLLQYSKELVERIRIDENLNNRRPSHLSVHALHEGEEKSLARSCQWSTYDSEAQLMEKAYSLLISNSRQRPGSLGPESEKRGPSPWTPSVVNIGMCADQFKSTKAIRNTASITQFFQPPSSVRSQLDSSTRTDVHIHGAKLNENSMTAVASGLECRTKGSASVDARTSLAAGSTQVQAHTNDVCSPFPPAAASPYIAEAKPLASTSMGGSNGIDADNEDAVPDNEDDWHLCEQCGKKVSAWHLPEHMDFHFALTLQAAERKSVRNTQGARGPLAQSAPAAKRLKTPLKSKQKPVPAAAPINSYFTRTPKSSHSS